MQCSIPICIDPNLRRSKGKEEIKYARSDVYKRKWEGTRSHLSTQIWPWVETGREGRGIRWPASDLGSQSLAGLPLRVLMSRQSSCHLSHSFNHWLPSFLFHVSAPSSFLPAKQMSLLLSIQQGSRSAPLSAQTHSNTCTCRKANYCSMGPKLNLHRYLCLFEEHLPWMKSGEEEACSHAYS